jgi:peptidoglycan/xylan/chitin deacetylase (PgdA/CDA1 family)
LRPIPILTYHQVATAPPKGAAYRSLYVAPSDFLRQMALLKWLGYRGLSMTALQPYLLGERVGKVVGITFDDGYLNNLTHALPVLRRFNFSSTCYAVSQRLGATNIWDEPVGILQTNLMTGVELRQWVAGGQEIGAHTRHHVHLTALDSPHAQTEITLCKTELEDACGQSVNHFCYPYGEYAPAHKDMVFAAGYQTATTTQRSRCGPGEDLMALPRVPIVRSTTMLAFVTKILTTYEDRRRV